MAYSKITATGNGVTKDYSVTFDYLDQSHVRVRVNKVFTNAVGSNYTFEFINATTVRITHVVSGLAPASGDLIEIIRETPIANPAVVFGPGVNLTSDNLNKNSEYLTYALQEASDTNQEFTKLYLGSKATFPTTDNDGEPLQTGTVIYYIPESALYYYTGSTWIIGESTVAAQTFAAAAEAAKNAAVGAQDAVAASATAAATSASNAFASATSASSSASSASTSATNAAASATSASNSASSAASSATSADASKTSAATSASSASASASAASTSASSAASSATSASTSATNAANSAASASTSATNAANSASAASTSANSASTSATNAATSATNAANSATTATTQATTATNQATSAANSATTATTQASNASASATAAQSSATAAQTSATNAASSASAAATSATNAASSASAAASARDATLAAFDSFDDRYLGAKSSDPTVDNDGNALVAGTLYFNSTTGEMRIYTGTAWVAAYVSGTGFVAKTGDTMSGPLTVNSDLTISDKIIHAGDTNTAIRFPAADTVTIETNGTERLRLDASGNLGLGVTPSAWGGAGKNIQLPAGGSITSNGATGYFSNTYFDGSNYRYITTTAAGGYVQNTNQHLWYTAPSGTAGNPITFTQAMTLDADGDLGVGTSSPAVRLHVNSGALDEVARFESTGNPYITLYDTGVRQGYWYSGPSQIEFGAEVGKYMSFFVNSAERIRINTNGTVVVNGNTTGVSTGLTVANGDITAYRSGGTTGVVYLGSSGGSYLYFDGTNYILGGSFGLTIKSATIPVPVGTAPLYPARAWVNFNGTGTVAIRDSGNVSSITDVGVGNYTVNLTTAMADANGSAVAGSSAAQVSASISATNTVSVTTRGSTGTAADASSVSVAVFR